AAGERRGTVMCGRSLSQSASSSQRALSPFASSPSFVRRGTRVHPLVGANNATLIMVAAAAAGGGGGGRGVRSFSSCCAREEVFVDSGYVDPLQQQQRRQPKQHVAGCGGGGPGGKLGASGSFLRRQQASPLATALTIVRNNVMDGRDASDPASPSLSLYDKLRNNSKNSALRAAYGDRQWQSFSHAEATSRMQHLEQKRAVPLTVEEEQRQRPAVICEAAEGGNGGSATGRAAFGNKKAKHEVSEFSAAVQKDEENEEEKEKEGEAAEEATAEEDDEGDPRVGSLAASRRWVSFPRSTPSYHRHNQPSEAALAGLRAEFGANPAPLNVPASASPPRVTCDGSSRRDRSGGDSQQDQSTSSDDVGRGVFHALLLSRQASRRSLLQSPSQGSRGRDWDRAGVQPDQSDDAESDGDCGEGLDAGHEDEGRKRTWKGCRGSGPTHGSCGASADDRARLVAAGSGGRVRISANQTIVAVACSGGGGGGGLGGSAAGHRSTDGSGGGANVMTATTLPPILPALCGVRSFGCGYGSASSSRG
ncbi:hypothetical protein Agub_g11950, partial [Astrephomene gubernaculifera]